jgi:hypothetical protein
MDFLVVENEEIKVHGTFLINLKKCIRNYRSWGYSSVLEPRYSMYKALGSIPSTKKKAKRGRKEGRMGGREGGRKGRRTEL